MPKPHLFIKKHSNILNIKFLHLIIFYAAHCLYGELIEEP